jgi:hypothetical protein
MVDRAGAIVAGEVLAQDTSRRLMWLALAGLLAVFLLSRLLNPSLSGEVQIGSGSPIPAGFIPIFNEAATVFDVNPYLLASVAMQESSFGAGAGWNVVNYAGCVGFMQICVGGAGGDSWDAVHALIGQPSVTIVTRLAYQLGARPSSYPLEQQVHPSYDDPFDAVMAAAVVLRAKVGGAPIPSLDTTAYNALCGYYGACSDTTVSYASVVLNRARVWEAQSALNPSVADASVGTVSTNGLYFPIQPQSLAVGTSEWTEDWGVDIATVGAACYPDAKEVAIGPGTIIGEGGITGYGPYAPVLRVDAGPLAGKIFYYGHAAPYAPGVVVGSKVQAGQVIAYVGCGDVPPGYSTGPHIEFGMYAPGGVFPGYHQTSHQALLLLEQLYHP